MIRVFVCLFLCACLPGAASAQGFSYGDEPSGEFLQNWLLCGPFPPGEPVDTAPDLLHLSGFAHDFLAASGGEAGAQPAAGDRVSFDGGDRIWTAYTSGEAHIDLDAAVSQENPALAYAYCEIVRKDSAPAILSVGSNDGVRVWLNGVQVIDAAESRGLRKDSDQCLVLLAPGVNRLLLKIEERGNLWALSCRLKALDATVIEGGVPLFTVREGGEKAPQLVLAGSESLMLSLLEGAEIEVQPRGGGEAILQQDWDGKPVMTLGGPPQRFQKLEAHLRVKVRGLAEPVAQVLPFTVGQRESHTVFAGGKSAYVIALGADASESEKWAAKELQHWLQEAGGVELPIVEDTAAAPDKAIYLGWNGQTAKAVGADQAPASPEDERFVYQSIGASLYIYGGSQRGTLYGVFSFLERELGCRWYAPEATSIPKKASYAFDALFHTESPGIRVRNDFYYEAFEPIWAARNRVNGAMSYREQPGGVEGYWSVHTFYPLMPPSEFFDTHPEYYSLIDGKRIHDHAQLCLTNPDVLRIMTERVLKTMRENPQYLIYSVSQNDWRQPCQCDGCQAIATREESEAGPLLHFVNQVADAAAKEFPDKFIGTLAYQYTRKPPKTIRPRENVVIRLCSIECCFAHDFHSCPENTTFIEDLEGWSAIAPHMYIWDYVVSFSGYLMPFPNFSVLQPNIKAFQRNHAIGIMEQAAYQSRGGEFAELRAYVIARLLWNPDCDVDAVIDDFMYGYYGRAGQYVRAYFDHLQGRVTEDTHFQIFGHNERHALFGEDFIRQADALFDQAEAVAESTELLHRVERTRSSLMYLKCLHDPVAAKADGTYARFQAICTRDSITHFAESGAPHREAFHLKVQAAE